MIQVFSQGGVALAELAALRPPAPGGAGRDGGSGARLWPSRAIASGWRCAADWDHIPVPRGGQAVPSATRVLEARSWCLWTKQNLMGLFEKVVAWKNDWCDPEGWIQEASQALGITPGLWEELQRGTFQPLSLWKGTSGDAFPGWMLYKMLFGDGKEKVPNFFR